MSQSFYPYIQTLHDFDESMSDYAIQPVGEDKTNGLAEENPILSFGPLGRINIFIGATNAGKSRFLRTLAKREKYQLYDSAEVHQAIFDLLTCCQWLAASTESVEFKISQGEHGMMIDGSPIVLHYLPHWAKEALKGVQARHNYSVNFDASFFEEMKPFFKNVVVSRVMNSNSHLKGIGGDAEDLQMAIWARNLIRGEKEAQQRDEEKKATIATQYSQHLESFKEKDRSYNIYDALYLKFEKIPTNWADHFVRMWDAFDYINATTLTATTKPAERFYIPVLRSAVSLRDEAGQRLSYDIFEQTVRKNYRLEDENLKIFTGNRLYDTIKRDRNGTPEVIARLRDFEKFLGEAFYEERRVEIVALDEAFEAGQHINVRVQGEQSRELHDLGDGINTLIILLYQMFMAKPGSWIFIEEPELNLHPGLQRVFLQTLLENEALQKRDLRIFFTTHSNHLLRMTLRDGTVASNEISVFAFQQRESQKDKFLIRPLFSEYHDALALLGVQNASVLLAQCGIWVEGPTDRQYVRAYLNAYQASEEFKKARLPTMREDTNFAFWEYAGSNLAHYFMGRIPRKNTDEAEEFERGKKEVLDKIQSSALCNRIFLMADRDERKTKKHADLEALAKARSNFAYYVTSGVEIENVLSPREIELCLPKFFLGSKDLSVAFLQNDYKDIRMGAFLAQQFPNDFKPGWEEKGGTLVTSRKNRLCELAVSYISWETMSKESKTLAKTLYNFIRKHNEI